MIFEDSGPRSPCRRDCKDRSVEPNCHMICKAFLEYEEARKIWKAKELKGRKREQQIRDYEKTRARQRRGR